MDNASEWSNVSFIKHIRILDGSFMSQMMHYRHYDNIKELYQYNKSHADDVYKVHIDFLQAGANVIRTNTTRAFFSVMSQGNSSYTLEKYNNLIKQAVNIAKTAVCHQNKEETYWEWGLVVGSCGRLDPTTVMTYDEIENEYRCLIKALSEAGVNIFCLESIRTDEDATMLLNLLNELPTKDICALMMFETGINNFLYNESSFIEMVRNYGKLSNIWGVGINCVDPEEASELIKKINENQPSGHRIPLIVCCNKPSPYDHRWNPLAVTTDTPAVEWLKLGVYLIGGCCNVKSEDIKLIQDELKRYNESS